MSDNHPNPVNWYPQILPNLRYTYLQPLNFVFPYLIFSQLGRINEDIPYGSLKVPTRTYLMGDETVREEIREVICHPSVELLQRIGQVLQESKTPFR
jgi:hypothetical protein